ncbi:MAG: hypothetical protein V1712_03895 [Patescibacteria group bacterium]
MKSIIITLIVFLTISFITPVTAQQYSGNSPITWDQMINVLAPQIRATREKGDSINAAEIAKLRKDILGLPDSINLPIAVRIEKKIDNLNYNVTAFRKNSGANWVKSIQDRQEIKTGVNKIDAKINLAVEEMNRASAALEQARTNGDNWEKRKNLMDNLKLRIEGLERLQK